MESKRIPKEIIPKSQSWFSIHKENVYSQRYDANYFMLWFENLITFSFSETFVIFVSKAFWHSIISIQSKLSSNLFNITSAGINKHKFAEILNLNQDYSCTTVLQIINLDLPIKMTLKIQSTPYPIPKFSLVVMYQRFFSLYCCCCFIVWPRC